MRLWQMAHITEGIGLSAVREMLQRGAVHTVLIETPTSGSHTCD